MRKNYQSFKNKHPYLTLFLWTVLASFIGIMIEYILNKDFIAGGIFTTIGLFIISALQIKKKNSHKD